MTTVAVHHLHKSYNGKPAVQDLSFSVAPGEMLGLIFFSLLFGYFMTRIEGQPKQVLKDFWQGLYEVMAMSPRLRKAVMEERSTDDLQAIALEEGMLTLRMDGLKKVERGVTTLEEVIRVTQED